MRLHELDDFGMVLVISIHAPVKGATMRKAFDGQVHPISIHAPVKGATCGLLFDFQPVVYISIHAPVKGATRQNGRRQRRRTLYFNPRTREGCDLKVTTNEIIIFDISIHAPVKGATTASAGVRYYRDEFGVSI